MFTSFTKAYWHEYLNTITVLYVSMSPKRLDDADLSILRRIIYDFHLTENCVLTMSEIFKKFSSNVGYNGLEGTLRNEVKKLGFCWRKTQNNRKILMEGHEVRYLRIQFLKKMRFFRKKGRNIVYIHLSHTKNKGWSDNSTSGVQKPTSKGKRQIIVHAAGEQGFGKNAYAR